MGKLPADVKSDAQRRHIGALKHRVADDANGDVRIWESDDLDGDTAEAYWESVVDFENAPQTTNFRQLEEQGIELPPPDALDDAQIGAKLWEVIDGLSRLRVFLSETDHLSDRELYSVLWHDVLREPAPAFSAVSDVWHVSLCGGGSEEDTRLYLKYYADERWRQDWREQFPEYDMPAPAAPPYGRDSKLPQAYRVSDVQ